MTTHDDALDGAQESPAEAPQAAEASAGEVLPEVSAGDEVINEATTEATTERSAEARSEAPAAEPKRGDPKPTATKRRAKPKAKAVVPSEAELARALKIDTGELAAAIEALLFVSDRPLGVGDIVEVLLREREEREEQSLEEFLQDNALGKDVAMESRDETAMESRDETATESRDETAMESRDETAMESRDAPATAPDADVSAATSADPEPLAEPESASSGADLIARDLAAAALEPMSAEPAPAATSPETEAPSALSEHAVRRVLQQIVHTAFTAVVQAYQDPERPLGRGFELVQVGDAYQLRSRAECARFVRHYLQVKPTRLTRAQVETLAIVAYRQPVTRAEIEQIRGVDCGAALRILLERRLLRILGKKEEVGRPLLYGTTKEFLEFFNLKSLLELPTLREFQELSDEHRKKVEEELKSEAPLGSIKDLAAEAPKLTADDMSAMQILDGALQAAKATMNRVAEATGFKAPQDDEPERASLTPTLTKEDS